MSARPFRRSRTTDDEADDVFALPAVTFDLSREHVDRMADSLVGLLDTQERRLLVPELRPEHLAVVDQLDALAWNESAQAIEQALALLNDATRPGGVIDPNDDYADVPWARMLVRLTDLPVEGSRAARQWFADLYRLRTQDVPVSTICESTAAYAVAAFEYRRARMHEVERWSMTAGLQTEFDAGVGRGAVAFIRAARLLEGVLRQPTKSSP